MKLSNKTYDILKWIVMIVIPACTTAYVGLAAIWGFPCAEEIAKTSAVVCTLLGALLGISTAQYNKDGESEAWLSADDVAEALTAKLTQSYLIGGEEDDRD